MVRGTRPMYTKKYTKNYTSSEVQARSGFAMVLPWLEQGNRPKAVAAPGGRGAGHVGQV